MKNVDARYRTLDAGRYRNTILFRLQRGHKNVKHCALADLKSATIYHCNVRQYRDLFDAVRHYLTMIYIRLS